MTLTVTVRCIERRPLKDGRYEFSFITSSDGQTWVYTSVFAADKTVFEPGNRYTMVIK